MSSNTVATIEDREIHVYVAYVRGELAKEQQEQHNPLGKNELTGALYALRRGEVFDRRYTTAVEQVKHLDDALAYIEAARKQRANVPMPKQDDRPGSDVCMSDVEYPAGPDNGFD